jgi:hypothetical protein
MRPHTVLITLALAATPLVHISAQTARQGAMRTAPSGRATTEVTLTYVDSAARAAAKPATIRIDYGQPHLRGRRILTDSLVPYDKPWRTGANAATMLTTDVDLTIGGASVPKGSYVILSMPSRSGWTLIIQRDVRQSPLADPAAYDPANDLARIALRQTTLASPLESLTFWLIPSTQPGPPHGELRFAWGTAMLATDWSMR